MLCVYFDWRMGRSTHPSPPLTPHTRQGTQVYDAKQGAFVNLGILDVLQIFGRAGRPQFDSFGEGTIITTHDKLSHYLSLLTRQLPIESQLIAGLTDNLNAEVGVAFDDLYMYNVN